MVILNRPNHSQRAQFTRLRDFGAFQPSGTSAYPQQFSAWAHWQHQPSTVIGHRTRWMKALWQKTQRTWRSTVFRVICTVALCCFLCRSFSWTSLLAALMQARPGMLLVGVVVGVGGVIVSAYQWQSLLRSEQIRFDLADLVNLYVVGITFNHFLPTGMGGDAMKALYVGQKAANGAGATSAVLMCRVTGFLGMLLIALPTLVLWHGFFALNILLWFVLLCSLAVVALGGTVVLALLLPGLAERTWSRRNVLLPLHSPRSCNRRNTRQAAGDGDGDRVWLYLLAGGNLELL